MTVYGPEITAALETYATQFDDLKVQERTPIFDLNAINPLSELRESWNNVTSDETEHRLQTTGGVDEQAFLETDERGQYTAGFEAQAGLGVRVPQQPSNDEEIIWGYFTADDTHTPINGWYFGIDSTDIFVAEVRDGVEKRVYRDDWNANVANGTGQTDINTDKFVLDLAKGNIFQIEFVYYGYGPVRMTVLTDDGKLTLHEFIHDGQTSVENTNLPIQTVVDNNGTNADGLDLYVGGRQFSIIGDRSTSTRPSGHFVDSVSNIDDTQWYYVMSVQLKDGSVIGSTNFRHVLADVQSFVSDTDSATYRWQLRRGTSLTSPSWETPDTHSDKPGETAIRVDTSATDFTDGSGNLTGVFIDGGTLDSGQKNKTDLLDANPSGELVNGEIVTLLLQASPGQSGTVSEIFLKLNEGW
jgi:hypothetical protein